MAASDQYQILGIRENESDQMIQELLINIRSTQRSYQKTDAKILVQDKASRKPRATYLFIHRS
ncbi:MAG: hypothetical protein B7Y39_16165 [Bdellovibrio sp. 28-41-41]|nr:MAG: hypothetical protein B7Y39_16165 [Bdellovibrio sp. 28-41-41]